MHLREIKKSGREEDFFKIDKRDKPPVMGRLESLLKKEEIPYRVIPHREVFTSLEVAESIHISGRKVVKVVIVGREGENLMLVLPSHRRVDLVHFGEMFGEGPLSLLEGMEVEKQFPDCEAGAIPPFGNFYDIPVYVDSLLARESVIFFKAGSHREVVEMRYQDFLYLVQPIVSHFVQEPFRKVSGF
ncbi:MAG: aminoacyl-tRNA deacylase [Nitrospiria bacterium]